MGCGHNYVYTQGYFVCTKCGKRSYGRSYRKKQGKKVAAGIIIGLLAVVGIFAFSNGIFEINQEKLDTAIESIPAEIPKVDIKLPDISSIDVEKIVPEIQKELPKITEAPSVIKPELNVSNIESLIHQKINYQRNQHGLTSLVYDDQISDIARSHSQDMARNNYFDHVSLSGKEPWDRGFPYGYQTCGTLDAIALQNKYDELSREYDKYPQTTTSQSQYQQAMALYNQLNSISDQLNSMIENGQLFGGLAENIFQNWTYESITYVNGIPLYDWNTDEQLAQQVVNGWMTSPGHRQNILSGFHSEGIGVVITSDDKVYITQNFC